MLRKSSTTSHTTNLIVVKTKLICVPLMTSRNSRQCVNSPQHCPQSTLGGRENSCNYKTPSYISGWRSKLFEFDLKKTNNFRLLFNRFENKAVILPTLNLALTEKFSIGKLNLPNQSYKPAMKSYFSLHSLKRYSIKTAGV